MSTLQALFSKAQKAKFYAVAKGREIGVFNSWEECKPHVNEFPGAIFKGFKTHEECDEFLKKKTLDLQQPEKPLLPISEFNPEDLQLSPEQFDVFQHYKNGKNVFMTGPGGTGKSKLIQHIYNDAKENKLRIQVCAMTGCAAVLLECHANTLHSWAGIGLARGNIDEIVTRVIKSKIRKKNWINIKLLIVDEVSMLSLKLLIVLDLIAKKIKKNNKLFGGIQVIFAGDFHQLSPIGDDDDLESWAFVLSYIFT